MSDLAAKYVFPDVAKAFELMDEEELQMSRPIKFRVWNKNTNKYEYTELDYYFVIDQRIKAYEYEQYTGLKDKNGKEIYEGDIVSCGDRYPANTINFSDGRFWLGDSVTDLFEANLKYDIDIIGNIHENADLLGGER